MPAASLRNQAPGTRVNFVINTLVDNRLRFNNFSYQGEVGFTAAAAMSPTDIRTLVDATSSHFRAGSPTNAETITYIVVKQSESMPLVVIPEPLIQLNTVEVAGNTVHTVIVRDAIAAQQLTEILTGNGLRDFSLTSSQV